MTELDFAVEMLGIGKRFGNVQALDAVDLKVRPSTIHALVGENGAGKTTLMRILYGLIPPSTGVMKVYGEAHVFKRATDAISLGIGMVSQHYSIIPELSCIENLTLGAEPGALIDWSACIERAQTLANEMGFEFDWIAPASTLTPAAAQKLEILKLLWRKAKIMILDEPTAMLSPQDSDALYASLRELTKAGATVIVVTHRLPEVVEACDEVTVLRGGKWVASSLVSDTDAVQLAEQIIGHPVSAPGELTSPETTEIAFEFSGIVIKGARGDHAVAGASLGIRKGEMVGIAGVDGSGQRELFWGLMGLRPIIEGSLKVGDTDVTHSTTATRIDQLGLRLIPEDRHDEGVVEDWNLLENAMLGLHRLEPFSRSGQLISSNQTTIASEIASRFKTKFGKLEDSMESLSGGNQQRFVAARALWLKPNVILAFQPARGLDIEATNQVYAGIREACSHGAAALIVSFDLDELLLHCHRVVAMNHGKIYEVEPGHEKDRARIGQLMVGT